MHYNTTIQKVCPTKSIKKQDISEKILTFSIILIMGCILFDSQTYAISVTNGLKLFFFAVLPGLLPFMFLCKILSNFQFKKLSKLSSRIFKPLFGISGNCFYPFFMSIISGYPIGSKITSDLFVQGKIEKHELFKVSMLSSTSGLIFIIGTVGQTMLKSTKIGLIIYFSNIFSAILSVFFLNLFQKIKQKKNIDNSMVCKKAQNKKEKNIFKTIDIQSNETKKYSICDKNKHSSNSKNNKQKETINEKFSFLQKNITLEKSKNKNISLISSKIQTDEIESKNRKTNIHKIITLSAKETAESLLVVCFYISFFSVIIDIMTNTNILVFLSLPLKVILGSIPEKIELSSGIMSGIVEITRGIKILSNINSTLSICLISSLISFGGFSIIFQSMSFLSNTNIKFSKFIFAKLFQAILSFFLCYLIILFFLI